MTDELRGKVVKVLNNRELVINRGREHGVRRGQIFRVLAKESKPIFDIPEDGSDGEEGEESGEIIGYYRDTKTAVEVVETQEKTALARTFREFRVNVGGAGVGLGNISDMFKPPKYEYEVETFSSTNSGRYRREKVVRGDDVELVTDGTDDVTDASLV